MICRAFAGSKSGPEFAVFAVQNIGKSISTENQYLHYILKGMVEGGMYIAWLKQSKYDRTATESNCPSSSTSAHVK
jgi:hypothetical protein